MASYILYFAAMGVACSVGLFGCWGMSSTKLIATSISLLFAFVFGVSGMGLFHAAHFYETNKVIQVQFLLIEPTNVLKYWKNIFFNNWDILRFLKKLKKKKLFCIFFWKNVKISFVYFEIYEKNFKKNFKFFFELFLAIKAINIYWIFYL